MKKRELSLRTQFPLFLSFFFEKLFHFTDIKYNKINAFDTNDKYYVKLWRKLFFFLCFAVFPDLWD